MGFIIIHSAAKYQKIEGSPYSLAFFFQQLIGTQIDLNGTSIRKSEYVSKAEECFFAQKG